MTKNKQKLKYEILDFIIDRLPASVAYWTKDEICVYANDAFLDWIGKPKNEAIGKTMAQTLGEKLYSQNKPHIDAVLAKGEVQRFVRKIKRADGHTRKGVVTYTPYIDKGKVLGFIAHVSEGE